LLMSFLFFSGISESCSAAISKNESKSQR
jgi:hypothetical protein